MPASVDVVIPLADCCPGAAIGALDEQQVTKQESDFRQYDSAQDRVKKLYAEQHAKQTVEFNINVRREFEAGRGKRARMSVWEAIEKVSGMVDQSDPDTDSGQIDHLMQTAEALRRDGKPRWMQLAGLIHDVGKLWSLFSTDGDWAVVGDTFPVGCAFDDAIVYPDSFGPNPDRTEAKYMSKHGIYSPGCGLDNVMLSWGHDEYLYHVVRHQSRLPAEALAIIRYHSFYPWHSAGAYDWMMDEHDHGLLAVVQQFSRYDLYSKADAPPDVEQLKPYYLDLIDEFFPQKVIEW